MKKLVKIVAAIALALSMTATVFAAPSNTVNGTTTISKAVDDKGNVINLTRGAVKAEDQAKVDAAVADISATLKSVGINTDKPMKVASTFDIESYGNVTFPATVTFAVTGLTADMEAYLLHGTADGFENVTKEVSANGITGEFTSFSPVIVVMEDNSAASNTTASNAATSNTAASAGKTGPATGVSYAWHVVIAVFALGGMTFLTIASKKKAR